MYIKFWHVLGIHNSMYIKANFGELSDFVVKRMLLVNNSITDRSDHNTAAEADD